MRLTQRIKKNIQRSPFFGHSATVIVGCSGGSDSTALTHVLHALQYELGFHLHIAHYNHNLRRSAATDQKFVQKLAEQLNVPCTVGLWKNHKPLDKGSLEDAARRQRLQFFNRLAKRIGAEIVVLAHTQDDLAETVLMRILRGTGLHGLRGILPVREMDGVHFIRPMLNVKKDQILEFLKQRDIPFRADPTNQQTKFFRNRVRLDLLPELKKHYNHNIQEILTNLADNIATDYNYLEEQGRKLYAKLTKCSADKVTLRIDLKSFLKLHPALQRMLVRIATEQLKGDLNRINLSHFREIDNLLLGRPKGATVHLPDNIRMRKNTRTIILTLKQPS